MLARLLAQAPPLPFALALLMAWLAHHRWRVRVPRGRSLGAAVLGAGLALDGWSIATQLRAGSSPLPAAERSTLVTSGPYALEKPNLRGARTRYVGPRTGAVAHGVGIACGGLGLVGD